MNISSRTPEGMPHRCPVCGKATFVETSFPGEDSCCPNCGQLLWWFRDRLSQHAGIAPELITLTTSLGDDFAIDSLDIAEMIMQLEDELGVKIPNDEAERFRDLADIIRYIDEHRLE